LTGFFLFGGGLFISNQGVKINVFLENGYNRICRIEQLNLQVFKKNKIITKTRNDGSTKNEESELFFLLN